jgi:imidazolonepropionase-like amidohydrolase
MPRHARSLDGDSTPNTAAGLLLTNCRIFDGVRATLAHGDVLVRDGEIVDVSPRALEVPHAQRIDVGRRVVIPGLIDAHFHAYATSRSVREIDATDPTLRAHRARPLLESALRRGFTSVRDAAGGDAGLARAVDEGLINGPRIFFGGKALTQTGGHGDMRPGDDPCCCKTLGLTQIVDGADAVRLAAREELRRGAHQIKIFVSGGVVSPTDPIWMDQFSDDEIRAAVEEAATRRAYVLAHAYTSRSIRRSVALGVRSIEHANLIDRETAKFVADHGAFVDPTLVTYDAMCGSTDGLLPQSLAKLKEVEGAGQQAVAYCHEAGVRLGLGTDLLGDLHRFQSHEFGLRAKVQDPIDVLRSATSINAELVQRAGKLGTIAAGAIADLLVVDGNPLEDIELLERSDESLLLIVKDGRIVKDALSTLPETSVFETKRT